MKEAFRVKVSHSLGGVAGDFHPQTPRYLLIAKNQLFQATALDVLWNFFFFFQIGNVRNDNRNQGNRNNCTIEHVTI